MYPADGSSGDLPVPRMSSALPPWVSSLVPEHRLPEAAAVTSSSEVPEGLDAELVLPGTDLVSRMGTSEGDSSVVQQFAGMRLESQTDSSLPQPIPLCSSETDMPGILTEISETEDEVVALDEVDMGTSIGQMPLQSQSMSPEHPVLRVSDHSIVWQGS